MIYRQEAPSPSLQHLIESFWMVDSEGVADVETQKIIPDGYPELIFHYEDPYKIDISGTWEEQSAQLVAGQITRHFYLQNTGVSGMIGVKLKPTALYEMFQLDMSSLLDKVCDLTELLPDLNFPRPSQDSFEDFCGYVEELFSRHVVSTNPHVSKALDVVFEQHGMLSMAEMLRDVSVSERQLERLFRKQVGLTPKFYSRVIRLSYLFKQVEQGDYSWAALAYRAGFTDQSHLIKNFQEFTGEDPSKYQFEAFDMANFFLKR